MADGKPTTLWAAVSLIFSSLGCLATLALWALAERYAAIANRTAGVGSIYMVAHAMLVLVLCLVGVLCGGVALLRISSGRCGGRRMTWTGIVLGCVPLALAIAAFLLSKADSNPFR